MSDLYHRRRDTEVKQVKRSLKLSSFLGHNANAARWQVYSALLVPDLPKTLKEHIRARLIPRLEANVAESEKARLH